MNIIKHKFVFLSIAVVLMAASVASIAVYGLRPGIDFSGGVSWQLKFTQTVPTLEQLQTIFPSAVVTPQDGGQFLIRLPVVDDVERQQILVGLHKQFGDVEEMQFQNIGPAVGEDLKRKAIWAVG